MHRVLSIWLPQLPLNRLERSGDLRLQKVFAVTAEIKNAWRITHLSSAAYAAGLTAGMSVPDARTIAPELLTEPDNPMRNENLLRALWRWADALSPWVSVAAPDGLLLDITGCSHLFGGEEKMAEHALERLADMQMDSRIAIADTKGAAWALSRFGRSTIALAACGETADALQDISLAGLNLAPAVLNDLRRSGLNTFKQLYPIKSSELARRFGLELTSALAKTLGHAVDPVLPKSADQIYAARMTLPEPIGLLSDLQAILERLANSVCGRLKKRSCGARRFYLTVRCVDTGDHSLIVGFAKPCAEPDAVIQQYLQPLDKLKIEFGADWFRLEAKQIEPVQPQQKTLLGEPEVVDYTAEAVSTLGNRLGFDRVWQFVALDSHLPEQEFCAVEVMDRNADAVWYKAPRKRPLRLFQHPEALHILKPGRPPQTFQWRKKVYQTLSTIGPERLTPEWWQHEQSPLRDYWRVQTESGLRLWLLNYPGRKKSEWFVAGRFP